MLWSYLIKHHMQHTNTILTASQSELAGCLFDSQSPVILILRIPTRQTKTLCTHVVQYFRLNPAQCPPT